MRPHLGHICTSVGKVAWQEFRNVTPGSPLSMFPHIKQRMITSPRVRLRTASIVRCLLKLPRVFGSLSLTYLLCICLMLYLPLQVEPHYHFDCLFFLNEKFSLLWFHRVCLNSDLFYCSLLCMVTFAVRWVGRHSSCDNSWLKHMFLQHMELFQGI